MPAVTPPLRPCTESASTRDEGKTIARDAKRISERRRTARLDLDPVDSYCPGPKCSGSAPPPGRPPPAPAGPAGRGCRSGRGRPRRAHAGLGHGVADPGVAVAVAAEDRADRRTRRGRPRTRAWSSTMPVHAPPRLSGTRRIGPAVAPPDRDEEPALRAPRCSSCPGAADRASVREGSPSLTPAAVDDTNRRALRALASIA